MACCKKNCFLVKGIVICLLGYGNAPLSAQNAASAYSSGVIRGAEIFLEKSKQDEITLTQTKKLLSVEYDSMVVEIIRLKEKKEVGFFDRLQLKNLLKDCEDISQQFMKMDQLLAAHKEADRMKAEELIGWMDDEIKFELLQLQKNKRSRDADFSTEPLQAMIAEKSNYQKRVNDSLGVRIASVKASKNDDEELLVQKADFLMDQQEKLLNYMKEIDRAIRRYRAENEIKTTSERLLDPASDREGLPKKVKSILSLSRERILFSDEILLVIEKLNEERQAAAVAAKRFESEAKELYWLAQYKANH